jgi:predicted Rossmann fold nucleotide-binding protein DprA/Smf involved in DNA uptake
MRVVGIVGSRHWEDYDAFRAQLPDLSAYDTIVSGGQYGVDDMAERLARDLRKRITVYSADAPDTKSFTQAAHERNQKIVDAADALIAFPGPNSKGTWDTVRRAKEKGIPVFMRKAET